MTATRLADFPELPTISEFVPGYEASGWNGIAVPKNTPSDVIEQLNRGVVAALANPAVKR
jgi:tripartite-type tricarboxylate transporter receptor subunit TctC